MVNAQPQSLVQQVTVTVGNNGVLHNARFINCRMVLLPGTTIATVTDCVFIGCEFVGDWPPGVTGKLPEPPVDPRVEPEVAAMIARATAPQPPATEGDASSLFQRLGRALRP